MQLLVARKQSSNKKKWKWTDEIVYMQEDELSLGLLVTFKWCYLCLHFGSCNIFSNLLLVTTEDSRALRSAQEFLVTTLLPLTSLLLFVTTSSHHTKLPHNALYVKFFHHDVY